MSITHPPFSQSPEELSNDEHESRRRVKGRKDSGYSEGLRRPIYRSSSNSNALDFLQLEASLIEVARLRDDSSRRSSRRSSKNKSQPAVKTKPSKQWSDQTSKVTQDPDPTRPISRRESSNLTSANSSIHGKSRILSRTTSISSPISSQDPYLVHQKAKEIIQALEIPENAVSSSDATRPTSLRHHDPISKIPSIVPEIESESTVETQLENQLSPLYTAIHMDWTDPSTRKQAYERHDRDNRGLRKLLKKLVPQRWQTERLEFYDGNSDAGSVRRYRMDIEDSDNHSCSSQDLPKTYELKRARHTFSCMA